MKAQSITDDDAPETTAGQLQWMEYLSARSAPSWVPARLHKLTRGFTQDRTGSWHVLKDRRFRAYFIGCTVSNLGTWLQNTAQMLLAYELTHSVFDVAIITSAQFSGFLTIGPWAGGLADRLGRKNVLVGTQLVSMVVTGVLALLELNGKLTEAELVVGALGTGLALTFALPVQTAMVSALVPERDKKAALAMNSVSYNAGRTLAPLLCLAVLASIGTGWAFALNSISFFIFALIVAAVYPSQARGRQHRVRHRAVLAIAFQRPRIMLLLAMVAAVTFADDPVFVLGPSLTHQLRVPSSWPAYFLAALGVGTILGAMFPTRPIKTRRAAIPLVVLAISVVAFALGLRPWISLLAAIVAGMAGLLTGSASQALLLQRATPAHAVQVMALWAVAWAGTKPIASFADGMLASHLGIHRAAMILVLPAFTIGMTEICLGKNQKAWLKDRMSAWNGTRNLQATRSTV